jgi:hypothetical protein
MPYEQILESLGTPVQPEAWPERRWMLSGRDAHGGCILAPQPVRRNPRRDGLFYSRLRKASLDERGRVSVKPAIVFQFGVDRL